MTERFFRSVGIAGVAMGLIQIGRRKKDGATDIITTTIEIAVTGQKKFRLATMTLGWPVARLK